jgi:hypothetical protein
MMSKRISRCCLLQPHLDSWLEQVLRIGEKQFEASWLQQATRQMHFLNVPVFIHPINPFAEAWTEFIKSLGMQCAREDAEPIKQEQKV